MSEVIDLRREINFTIDGEPFATDKPQQKAEHLLRLAGLAPGMYDLGELHGHDPRPKRFEDSEEVEIRPGARFVSIRQKADVA